VRQRTPNDCLLRGRGTIERRGVRIMFARVAENDSHGEAETLLTDTYACPAKYQVMRRRATKERTTTKKSGTKKIASTVAEAMPPITPVPMSF
jgi:hypothetical protein